MDINETTMPESGLPDVASEGWVTRINTPIGALIWRCGSKTYGVSSHEFCKFTLILSDPPLVRVPCPCGQEHIAEIPVGVNEVVAALAELDAGIEIEQ